MNLSTKRLFLHLDVEEKIPLLQFSGQLKYNPKQGLIVHNGYCQMNQKMSLRTCGDTFPAVFWRWIWARSRRSCISVSRPYAPYGEDSSPTVLGTVNLAGIQDAVGWTSISSSRVQKLATTDCPRLRQRYCQTNQKVLTHLRRRISCGFLEMNLSTKWPFLYLGCRGPTHHTKNIPLLWFSGQFMCLEFKMNVH